MLLYWRGMDASGCLLQWLERGDHGECETRGHGPRRQGIRRWLGERGRCPARDGVDAGVVRCRPGRRAGVDAGRRARRRQVPLVRVLHRRACPAAAVVSRVPCRRLGPVRGSAHAKPALEGNVRRAGGRGFLLHRRPAAAFARRHGPRSRGVPVLPVRSVAGGGQRPYGARVELGDRPPSRSRAGRQQRRGRPGVLFLGRFRAGGGGERASAGGDDGAGRLVCALLRACGQPGRRRRIAGPSEGDRFRVCARRGGDGLFRIPVRDDDHAVRHRPARPRECVHVGVRVRGRACRGGVPRPRPRRALVVGLPVRLALRGRSADRRVLPVRHGNRFLRQVRALLLDVGAVVLLHHRAGRLARSGRRAARAGIRHGIRRGRGGCAAARRSAIASPA